MLQRPRIFFSQVYEKLKYIKFYIQSRNINRTFSYRIVLFVDEDVHQITVWVDNWRSVLVYWGVNFGLQLIYLETRGILRNFNM